MSWKLRQFFSLIRFVYATLKVKTLLTFELSQSESSEFNYNQSESTTQIWVAQLEVDKKCHEFSQTVIISIITVCAQATTVQTWQDDLWP